MSRRYGFRLALRYAIALILVVIFVFPVYWLFIISFKTPAEIFAFPPVWYPKSIQFNNYHVLFKDGDAETVGNSLVLAKPLDQMTQGKAGSLRLQPLTQEERKEIGRHAQRPRAAHFALHISARAFAE